MRVFATVKSRGGENLLTCWRPTRLASSANMSAELSSPAPAAALNSANANRDSGDSIAPPATAQLPQPAADPTLPSDVFCSLGKRMAPHSQTWRFAGLYIHLRQLQRATRPAQTARWMAGRLSRAALSPQLPAQRLNPHSRARCRMPRPADEQRFEGWSAYLEDEPSDGGSSRAQRWGFEQETLRWAIYRVLDVIIGGERKQGLRLTTCESISVSQRERRTWRHSLLCSWWQVLHRHRQARPDPSKAASPPSLWPRWSN